MQQQIKINFQQERDFGTIISDTLLFLKQNFKPFFSSIVLIVGPLILIMGLAYAFLQTTLMASVSRATSEGNPFGVFTSDYFTSAGLMVFCGFLANILLSSVTYNYMCLYKEKSIDEVITVSEVAKKVVSNIGHLLISSLAFLGLLALIVTVLVLIGIGVFSGTGVGIAVLFGFILFFVALIFIPIFMYVVSAGFYVVIRDRLFIFSALGKVRKYLSGNFWWTWLIIVVSLISLSILQMIFNMPATIVSMGKMFTRATNPETGDDSAILLMAFYTLGMFLTYCTYSITHVIAAFNFESHEEKKEAKGMMSQIDSI